MFNQEQIQELIDVVDYFNTLFVSNNIGDNFLTKSQKQILTRRGVDWQSLKNDYIDYAYRFGILATALKDKKKLKNMSFTQLKRFIASGNFMPLSPQEEYTLNIVKTQAYKDVMNLRNKVVSDIYQISINASQKERYQKIIKQEAQKAIENRLSISELSSILSQKTQDWSRDFDRIADYIMHSAYQAGKANMILNRNPVGAKIWFQVHHDACKYCKSVYLYNEKTNEPRLYYLKDVINNGSNIGVKPKDYKPSVYPLHPHSLTEGSTPVLTDNGWKKISDINVGDYVLTHMGRFKKVISTIKNFKPPADYPKQIVKIYFKHNDLIQGQVKGDLDKITLTQEHRLLTQRGWIEAKDLLITDKLFKLLKPCNCGCGRYVELHKYSKRCFEESCYLNLSSNIGKLHPNQDTKDIISKIVQKNWDDGVYNSTREMLKSENYKENLSEIVSNNWKNGNYDEVRIQKQTKENRGKFKDLLNKDGLALKMAKKAANTFTSKPQLKLYKNVKKLFPQASLEYEILGKSLDIALIDLKIDIEYDGWCHKYFDECGESDRKRDELLKSNGWHVLRYTKQPSIDKLREDIQLVSNNSQHQYIFKEILIEKIEHKKLESHHKLFDIGVEDDESFVARGVVIHNCRCDLNEYAENTVWDKNKQLFILKRNTYGVKRKSKINISYDET